MPRDQVIPVLEQIRPDEQEKVDILLVVRWVIELERNPNPLVHHRDGVAARRYGECMGGTV